MFPRPKATKVLLLDQQCAFRDLLHRELERQSCYKIVESGPVEGLPARCARLGAQLLVFNPETVERESVELMQEVRQVCPAIRVLLVARGDKVGQPKLVRAIHGGADGCVFRSEPLAQLLLALQVVSSGGRCLSPQTQAVLSDTAIVAVSKLTSRQCEVLRLIAEGFSTKEISSQLHVSVKTADHHRSRVMKRLNLHDVVGAVRFAIRTGLVAV